MQSWQKSAAMTLALIVAAFAPIPTIAAEIGDYKFTVAQDADHNVTGEGHYMVLDGRSLDTTAEADLFAVLGYAFGGSGSNFNLPDMRGRAAVAASDTLTVGTAQGAASVNLSVAQLPSHDHGAGTFTTGGGGGTPEVFIQNGVSDDQFPDRPDALAHGPSKTLNPPIWSSDLIRNAGGGGAVTGISGATGSGAAVSVLDPGLVVGVAFMLVDKDSRLGSDPHFASVEALLSFNGSLTEEVTGKTVTEGAGTAVLDVSFKKFGAASMLLTGGITSGEGVVVDISALTIGGEFTFEGWFATTSTSSGRFFTIYDPSAPNTIVVQVTLFTTGTDIVADFGGGTIELGWDLYGNGATVRDGAFNHIAVTRDATNTWRVFVNGVGQSSQVTPTDARDISGDELRIGHVRGFDAGWIGSVDEFRFTNGVARYTADFTPPTLPLPTN